MADVQEQCPHPEKFRRHLGRSLYWCGLCDHSSTLVGRPYFCSKCPDAHTMTYAEKIAHDKKFHPTADKDDG